MRTLLLVGAVSALAMTAITGAAQAATKLEVRDAVARVVIIPEARGDVKVELTKRSNILPLSMRVEGDTVKVDGGLKRNAIRGCNSTNGKVKVMVRHKGDIALDDMPVMTVRMPMDVSVAAAGGVFGQIGASGSVELRNAGCGDWKIADTRGKLKVEQAGSGDTEAGRAGALEVKIAGSGDVAVGAVTTDVDIGVAGSGDTRVASIGGGALSAKIAGSGDVEVENGRASALTASIAGSGDIHFGGVAGQVRAQIAGSGDVDVKRVEGNIDKRVIGSGSVTVGE
jgi:hypothetical protein